MVQVTLTGERRTDVSLANLSERTREYLNSLGISNPDQNPDSAKMVWFHSLAVGYSKVYLAENSDGIRSGWPRLPLPNSRRLLQDSALLGEQVAALLDRDEESEVNVHRVTNEMKTIAAITRVGGGSLNPKADLCITTGWGHGTELVMPGIGKSIKRKYSEAERTSIVQSGKSLKLKSSEIFSRYGEETYDIYLNDVAYWKNIPTGVWNYVIGGIRCSRSGYRTGIMRSYSGQLHRRKPGNLQELAGVLLLFSSLSQLWMRTTKK